MESFLIVKPTDQRREVIPSSLVRRERGTWASFRCGDWSKGLQHDLEFPAEVPNCVHIKGSHDSETPTSKLVMFKQSIYFSLQTEFCSVKSFNRSIFSKFF